MSPRAEFWKGWIFGFLVGVMLYSLIEILMIHGIII
jgi:hypothetical protein